MLERLRSRIAWPQGEKGILIVLWTLFAATGLYLVAAYFSGGSFVIDWVEESVSQPLRVLYDKFAAGLYEFSIFADNYTIVKTFRSGDIKINTTAAHVFLLVFVLALLFLLALATTLSRFYFLLFCGFFVLILVTFKLENVLLFGWYNKETYFLTLFAFLLPAYYFHAFRQHTALLIRFLAFVGVAAVFAALIAFFSEVEQPFFYIISYGLVSPLILSIIFILLIGIEIVKGFLTIVTRHPSENGKNNFLHFTILSVVYMGVLAMIFLYNENYIDWRIIFIDAVWILLAASVLGFWGFRDREETYSHIFRFQSTGAYIYLSLGIICFASLAYFFASGNDPLVEVLEDTVVFSQLAYSIVFFTYVVANFFPAMMEGLAVHKIVYKPKNMPFFTANLAALIGVIAFFLLSKMAAYYQSYSGYYISIANLHALEGDDFVASEYYELSNIYGKETHYGNLALAKMAEKNGESAKKENYLAKSINRNPTEFAFADLARHYERRADYFDALFVLSRGLEYFPSSGPLANNMGVLLSKTNVLDSAALYFLQASGRVPSADAAMSNMYALYTHDNLRISKDSLEQFMRATERYPAENNLMVTAAKNGYANMPLHHQIHFGSGITRDRLVYNFNAILYQHEKIDSSQWLAFRTFYDNANSGFFKDEMEYAFALAYAKSGRSIAAMRIFNVLNRADSYGYRKYDLVMAQYLMKYGAYLQALDYYRDTYRFYGANILAEMAFALMESGYWQDSEEIWQAVAQSDEQVLTEIAREMIALCRMENFREVVTRADREKYLFLKYRHKEITFQEQEGLILSIESPDFSTRAYIDLMGRLVDQGILHEAERIVAVVPADVYQDEHLAKSYLKQLARLTLRKEDINALADLLPALKSRQEGLTPYVMAVQALQLELEGYYDRAAAIYEELGAFDAFCEECILLAADFASRSQGDKMKAYTLLLDAIEINKYSLPLNKAYISKAIEMGLDRYADDVLEKMHEVLSSEEYLELMHYTEEQRNKYTPEW